MAASIEGGMIANAGLVRIEPDQAPSLDQLQNLLFKEELSEKDKNALDALIGASFPRKKILDDQKVCSFISSVSSRFSLSDMQGTILFSSMTRLRKLESDKKGICEQIVSVVKCIFSPLVYLLRPIAKVVGAILCTIALVFALIGTGLFKLAGSEKAAKGFKIIVDLLIHSSLFNRGEPQVKTTNPPQLSRGISTASTTVSRSSRASSIGSSSGTPRIDPPLSPPPPSN